MLYSFQVRLLSKLINWDSIIFSICICSVGRIVSVLPDVETDSSPEQSVFAALLSFRLCNLSDRLFSLLKLQAHFVFEIRITIFTVRAVIIVKSYILSSNFITVS